MNRVLSALRRRWKRLKRLSKRRPFSVALVAVVVIGSVGYSVYMTQRRLVVDPQTYDPLLSVIAKAESHGNYNAYFGHAGNKKIRFTDMTVKEVLSWQDAFVEKGSPSSAVGRYQILNTTLRSLIEEDVVKNTAQFDEATQDKLARALLDRRGGEAYVNGEVSKDEFAASLAQEWASLPSITGSNPKKSYYESHLNVALVSPKTVLKAVASVHAK